MGRNTGANKTTPTVKASVSPNLLTNKLMLHIYQIIPRNGIMQSNAHHQGLFIIFIIIT